MSPGKTRYRREKRMKNQLKGALMATVVAGLFLAQVARAADEGKSEAKTVECAGINSCKGKGACKGAGHECAGKNACKGQGFDKVSSAKECTDKGGKVLN